MIGGRQVGFVGNSVANLLVGVATLGYAVIVPAVVARQFGIDVYGTWYLAFQVSTYVVLLDLGSQYVVTNEAATESTTGQAARLATAAILAQAALGFAVVGAAASWAALTGQATLAQLVTILGLAAVASLLASTVRAWFGGLERTHVPAVWLVVARASALIGLVVAVLAGVDLVAVTLAVAVPAVVVHVGLLVRARRPPSLWARPDRGAFVRLGRRTLPLAVWGVCGVLIGGIDIFIVRAIEPATVGRYAIALALLALPAGVVTASMAAWIPRIARAEGETPGGGRQRTLTATTFAVAVLCLGAVPFVGYADQLVGLWAGAGDWDPAASCLQLLYVASALRFMFLPWAVLVLVRGEQARITLAPVVEAAVNLVASVLLGLWLGAIGVALGTVVGAVVAAVTYLFWAIPRTARGGITSSTVVQAAAGAWLPLTGAAVLGVLTLAGAPDVVRGVSAVLVLAAHAWWFVDHTTRALTRIT